MEQLTDSSASFSAPLFTPLQRYYVYLRVKTHKFSSRTLLLLSLFQTLQFVSFLFPHESERGLPWNYSFLRLVWVALTLTVSPPALVKWLGLDSAVVIAVALGLLAEQLVVSMGVMLQAQRLSHYDFVSELSDGKVGLVHPWLFRLHELSNFILLKLLFFPLVSYLAEDCTCLFDYTCLPTVQTPPYLIYLEAPTLAVLVIRKLTDVAFIGTVQWRTSDFESLSVCLYRVVLTWLETLMVLVTAVISYRSHPQLHSLLLVVLGACFLNYLYRRLPFHRMLMNQIKIIRGQLFLWSGFTNLIAEAMGGYSQQSVGPTLLYWLSLCVVLPMLFGLFSTRGALLSVIKRPNYLYEIEHMIREVLKTKGDTEEEELDKVISSALKAFPNSVDLTVWTINYYVLLKDAIFVKVTLAKLVGMKVGITSLVESFYTVFLVENWLRTSPTEREPLDYINMHKRFTQIRQHDMEICERLYETLGVLGLSSMRFDTVVSNFHRVMRDIEVCKHEYAETVKAHHSKELLDYYASFLDMLQHESKALSVRFLSSEVVKAQIKRRDTKVSLFDSHIMLVTMSLSPNNFGYVLSAKGSDLLGYLDEQVIGSHHSVLIPPPFDDNHDRMLRRITKFRHKHPVYESLHTLFFMDRTRFLVPADWRVCLINLPGTGELSVLAAIRPRSRYDDLAFVNPVSRCITVMVTRTQTRGFEQFLHACNLQHPDDTFHLSTADDWTGKLTVYDRRDVSDVDTFTVFGIRKQLILRLTVGGERRVTVSGELSPIRSGSVSLPKCLSWEMPPFELSTGASQQQRRMSEMPSRSSNSSKNYSTLRLAHKDKLRFLLRLIFWVKVVIACSTVILIAAVTAFVAVCEKEMEDVRGLFELVDVFQQIEIETAKAALVARDVVLLASSLGQEAAVRARASTVAVDLKTLSEIVRSRLTSNPKLWNSVHLNENIWWEFEQSRFSVRRKNLMDTLEALSMLCAAIAQMESPQSSPQLLTLFRNSYSDSFSYEARKYRELVSKSKGELQENTPVVVLLLSLSAVILATEVSLLFALVTAAERFRRKMWNFILTLPQLLVSLSKSVVANRLSIEFGHEGNSEDHSWNRQREISYEYTRSRYEKLLYCLLALLFFSSLTFLLVGVFRFFSSLDTVSNDLERVEDISIARVTNTLIALISMKETVQKDRFAAVSAANDAVWQWEAAINRETQSEVQFSAIFRMNSASLISLNYDSLPSNHSTLHLGLHSALNELTCRQMHFYNIYLTLEREEINREMEAIDALFYAMEPPLTSTMRGINAIFQREKTNDYYQVIAAACIFNGLVVLTIISLVFPLFLRVSASQFASFLRAEWDILLLIQDDDAGSLCARLKTFRSR